MADAPHLVSNILDHFKPDEVRRRSEEFLLEAETGRLAHVAVAMDKLDQALIKVLEISRASYPDLQIPPYGIWRMLETGGIDRWGAVANARSFSSAEEMLAAAADLAVIAVLMKTQRPANWRYEEPISGTEFDGEAASVLAAFNMFTAGSFSADASDPFRVDAEALIRMEFEELGNGLQWDLDRDKDLLGAMQTHLKRFGEALALRPDLFGEGEDTRPGLLAVHLAAEGEGTVDADVSLDKILQALAPVWTGGAVAGDLVLGDCFTYSGSGTTGLTSIMPFHLAAQEIVYSLVEPFAWAGVEVANLNTLTAPADIFHTALFIATDVMELKTEDQRLEGTLAQDRMVEVRAVTLALTSRLANLLRSHLDVDADQLPLTCILEGGTRRAGQEILRQDPIQAGKLGNILNPGSVFWLPFGA